MDVSNNKDPAVEALPRVRGVIRCYYPSSRLLCDYFCLVGGRRAKVVVAFGVVLVGLVVVSVDEIVQWMIYGAICFGGHRATARRPRGWLLVRLNNNIIGMYAHVD